MYFTKENAGRIDYFRWQIEDWRHRALIDEDEYAVLLASLIESVSSVSNTAGVYGAFLKKWDARALKPIMFRKVGALMLPSLGIEQRCGKIEDVIEDVPCDILYIDPPYTQNQYGTQYHIFETLVLADQPKISRITGSRSTAPYRSDWSKEYKAHILLDKIVAKTKARYVVMSYSNDGILSKDYIEAVLKRYGKPDTLVCEKIEYKQYLNWKAKEDERHFEYLFFVEKKPVNEVVYEAPLNYVGSKAKMMSDIRANLPENIDTLMDVFGGGRIKVIPTDMTMEIAHFNESDSLRSPQYMYNLLALRGMKKCSLCSCDVPEIIQGAHIWGVSQIKHIPGFSLDKKLEYALDGENGLWLCENHHKMFDANVISFNAEGKVLLRNNLMQSQKEFIEWATPTMQLPAELISDGFKFYISKRYAS